MLNRFVSLIDCKKYGDEWIDHAFCEWDNEQSRRKETYRISCWNILDQNTSNLMWGQYANARTGVALLSPYENLSSGLEEYFSSGSAGLDIEHLNHGLVSYDPTVAKTHSYFFKRPEFKDEKEIRLVAHSLEGEPVSLPLEYIIGELEIERPLDAPKHHVAAITSTWNALKGEMIELSKFT